VESAKVFAVLQNNRISSPGKEKGLSIHVFPGLLMIAAGFMILKGLAINIFLFLQGVCIFGLLGFRSMTSLYLFSTLYGFGYGGTGPQLPVVTANFLGYPPWERYSGC
jgi:hypothetical protein